jgi:hypothetical protein
LDPPPPEPCTPPAALQFDGVRLHCTALQVDVYAIVGKFEVPDLSLGRNRAPAADEDPRARGSRTSQRRPGCYAERRLKGGVTCI